VLPDDVQTLAEPVLAHRLIPSAESRLSGRSTRDVVADIVARVPVASPTRTSVRDRSVAG
jgi:MoxR-like ATPase